MQIAFNQHDEALFAQFPPATRTFFTFAQEAIERAVLAICPNAIATSGFRCPTCNADAGGLPYSRHLYALARDYRESSVTLSDLVTRLDPRFQAIRSNNCIHVQIVK